MIVQLRIDERLIHGQIAAAWAKALDFTHLVCASDAAVNDPLRIAGLKMAAPPGKKTFIKSVDDTIRLLDDPRAENLEVFIITDNPGDALKLVKALHIEKVNVANYHKKGAVDKIHITNTCVTDASELQVFEELAREAGDLYTQMLPSVDRVDFKALMTKVK